MLTEQRVVLKAEIDIKLSVEEVWELWTDDKHIVNWNKVSDDWVTRWAENDIRKGGGFFFRMETRDGNQGFDYRGEYTNVIPYQFIESVLDDGRKNKVEFRTNGSQTWIIETFEANDNDSVEMQQQFCQTVIENFKHYAESSRQVGLKN